MSIEVERTFAPSRSTPARVREFVSEMLTAWGSDSAGNDNTCLLASELATNAVVHAGTPITVRMNLSGDRLHVEVEDASSVMPEPLELTPGSERGRGLFLLQVLSDRWGADRCSTGKVVWFQLDAAGTALPIPERRRQVRAIRSGRLAG